MLGTSTNLPSSQNIDDNLLIHQNLRNKNLNGAREVISQVASEGLTEEDYVYMMNEKDSQGQTPLHLFAWHFANHPKELNFAELLVTKGCKVNHVDNLGNTALHTCVELYKDISQNITKYQSGIKSVGYTGNLGQDLREAVSPFMGFLLKNGCDHTIRNLEGKTALGTFQELIPSSVRIDRESLIAAYEKNEKPQQSYVAQTTVTSSKASKSSGRSSGCILF